LLGSRYATLGLSVGRSRLRRPTHADVGDGNDWVPLHARRCLVSEPALGERTGGRLRPRARPSRPISPLGRDESQITARSGRAFLNGFLIATTAGCGIATMRQSFAFRCQRRLARARRLDGERAPRSSMQRSGRIGVDVLNAIREIAMFKLRRTNGAGT